VNRGLAWSATLHVAFFLAFFLGPGPKPFEWDRADAIPVDLVSLPVEMPAPEPEPEPVKETPPPEVKPAPQEAPKEAPPEPKPVEQVRPKPKPKPQRVFKRYAPPKADEEPSLAERLQERLSKEEAAETPADTEPIEETPRPAPAASTAEVEATDFPYAWYLNVLRTKITAAWDPPGERLLAGHSRQVLVRFRIHRDGRITNVEVEGASGTPGLDTSARRAVEQGGPYPPLPEGYAGDWLDLGVRFTVEGKG